MSFKEKPTVHATVIWDSVTINNIFVLSPLSSKAGHFHIHASLSIILAIDNIYSAFDPRLKCIYIVVFKAIVLVIMVSIWKFILEYMKKVDVYQYNQL